MKQPKPVTREYRFGYVPDLPDHRDYVYTVSVPQPTPPRVDLRSKMPLIYDQGHLGSCTANALGALLQYNQIKQNKVSPFMPSRLFIYFNERRVNGSTDRDAGSSLRDGIKSMGWWGYCPEVDWPYDISRFNQMPSELCYTEAKSDVITDYRRVNQLINDLRYCLFEGHPIVVGIMVYESFMAARSTGIVNMPSLTENELGGHAVLIVGYDDAQNRFIVRNSWGTGWGQHGYFTMPYEYILKPDLCGDLWTINMVP